MRTICSLKQCSKTSVKYCLTHKVPLCFSCKHDQHYSCDTVQIIQPESLEYQFDNIYSLLVNLERFTEQLGLEQLFEGTTGLITKFKDEFLVILSTVKTNIDLGNFLTFEKHEKEANEFRHKIDNDEEMKVLMSRIYQQCVFKNLTPFESETLFDRGEGVMEDNCLKIVEEKKDNQCSVDENIDDVKVDDVPSNSPPSLESLRLKHFSGINKTTKSSKLFLNLEVKEHIEFMKESRAHNVKLVEVDCFDFRNLPAKSELLNSYLSKCLPDKLCSFLTMNSGESATSVNFSEYKSCVNMLIETQVDTLNLNNFILSKNDIEWLSIVSKEKRFKINLYNCVENTSCGKKLPLKGLEQSENLMIPPRDAAICKKSDIPKEIAS
ncbi:unnamed protein product [Moneuplotes crassus]|uniref:Uncharacterized protein n=1 Tax=Euplotes crassus TaxID=5936 RepID=A0AAD1X4G6_EUPCR|nr:unnamed protein product [Moneuplotes crassus]